MKKNYFYGAAFMLALMGTACNNAEDLVQDAPNALQVSVVNQTPESRAIITGETLPAESAIGVTLLDENGNNYDGIDEGEATYRYGNLKYTTTNGTAWAVTGTAPLLSSTKGKAIAYFPYGESVDYNAIALITDNQIDNMYSGWVADINNSKPQAKFTMNHAKAAFRVILKKAADYSATAIATAIKIKSAHFVESAKLDATKDAGSNLSEWSTGEADVTVSIADAGQTLDDTDGNYTDIMVIPAETAGTDIEFTVTIKDGNDQSKDYTVIVDNFTTHMAQGSCYQFTLTLTATGFEVSEVDVTPWAEVPSAGSGNLKPGA